MRIYKNGIYRCMTPEEIAEFESLVSHQPQSEPTLEDRIVELEAELQAAKILLGVE